MGMRGCGGCVNMDGLECLGCKRLGNGKHDWYKPSEEYSMLSEINEIKEKLSKLETEVGKLRRGIANVYGD